MIRISENVRSDAGAVAVNDGAPWYAVHTQPNREFRAKGQLENQAYHVFLPRRLKTVRHLEIMGATVPVQLERKYVTAA